MPARLHIVITEEAPTGPFTVAYVGISGTAAQVAYNAAKVDGDYARVQWVRDTHPVKIATPKRDGFAPVP